MNEELLRVEHISKYFAGVRALDDVSFNINRGEVRGLVGENGSGKSTMIKIIAGVYEPDKGDIYINGNHYKRLTPIISIREGIQVIYQDFSLFPNLTVAENIGINRVISKGGRVVNWKEVYESAKEGLSRVGADIPLDAITGELPTADRQIIAIARALWRTPGLLLWTSPPPPSLSSKFNIFLKLSMTLKSEVFPFYLSATN